jgi:hypothetical protein
MPLQRSFLEVDDLTEGPISLACAHETLSGEDLALYKRKAAFASAMAGRPNDSLRLSVDINEFCRAISSSPSLQGVGIRSVECLGRAPVHSMPLFLALELHKYDEQPVWLQLEACKPLHSSTRRLLSSTSNPGIENQFQDILVCHQSY